MAELQARWDRWNVGNESPAGLTCAGTATVPGQPAPRRRS